MRELQDQLEAEQYFSVSFMQKQERRVSLPGVLSFRVNQ